MKTQACIWLSPEDRATLEGWVADRNTPQKLVWRSRIVLLSADRVGKMAIVRAVGKCKRTVGRWQERYVARGLAGLQRDATRRGRKPPLAAAMIERAVKMTLHEKPTRRDALECPHAGQGARHQPRERAADLERTRPEAAFGQDL